MDIVIRFLFLISIIATLIVSVKDILAHQLILKDGFIAGFIVMFTLGTTFVYMSNLLEAEILLLIVAVIFSKLAVMWYESVQRKKHRKDKKKN